MTLAILARLFLLLILTSLPILPVNFWSPRAAQQSDEARSESDHSSEKGNLW